MSSHEDKSLKNDFGVTVRGDSSKKNSITTPRGMTRSTVFTERSLNTFSRHAPPPVASSVSSAHAGTNLGSKVLANSYQNNQWRRPPFAAMYMARRKMFLALFASRDTEPWNRQYLFGHDRVPCACWGPGRMCTLLSMWSVKAHALHLCEVYGSSKSHKFV